MWETDFDGTSMIRDPDGPAEGVRLRGLQLPDEVLDKLYRQNARRLLAAADRSFAAGAAAG
ncbi:MAG: hypothetical protein JW810_03030, partial [Sedimentisphaerales bacterium]|nr:hypothetical protein [Sedimentisphaerales bacterium]